jgi:hypothetical protein
MSVRFALKIRSPKLFGRDGGACGFIDLLAKPTTGLSRPAKVSAAGNMFMVANGSLVERRLVRQYVDVPIAEDEN